MFLYPVLTIAFAFSSVVYELYLAQTLTSALGGTNLRYAATIGIYITCMGVGAYAASQFSKKSPQYSLFWVEIILMTAGLFSGPFVLSVELLRANLSLFEIVSQNKLLTEAVSLFALLACHAPIVGIGILSGIELPLLMECSSRKRLGLVSQSANTKDVRVAEPHPTEFQSDVLAFDYVGTMIGAVCFPFLLFPKFGVFGVALFTLVCNALGLAVFVSAERKSFASSFPLLISFAAILISMVLFLNHQFVSQTLIENLYLMPQNEIQAN